jgi:hypothetical protein
MDLEELLKGFYSSFLLIIAVKLKEKVELTKYTFVFAKLSHTESFN